MKYSHTIKRKKTKKIQIGNIYVGGDSPITVQTMTNTLTHDIDATLGHLDTNTIEEILDSEKYQELIRAHEEERFDDISYCKNCDQLYEVPESLVWTNIESRKYNTSKVIEDMKLA